MYRRSKPALLAQLEERTSLFHPTTFLVLSGVQKREVEEAASDKKLEFGKTGMEMMQGSIFGPQGGNERREVPDTISSKKHQPGSHTMEVKEASRIDHQSMNQGKERPDSLDKNLHCGSQSVGDSTSKAETVGKELALTSDNARRRDIAFQASTLIKTAPASIPASAFYGVSSRSATGLSAPVPPAAFYKVSSKSTTGRKFQFPNPTLKFRSNSRSTSTTLNKYSGGSRAVIDFSLILPEEVTEMIISQLQFTDIMSLKRASKGLCWASGFNRTLVYDFSCLQTKKMDRFVRMIKNHAIRPLKVIDLTFHDAVEQDVILDMVRALGVKKDLQQVEVLKVQGNCLPYRSNPKSGLSLDGTNLTLMELALQCPRLEKLQIFVESQLKASRFFPSSIRSFGEMSALKSVGLHLPHIVLSSDQQRFCETLFKHADVVRLVPHYSYHDDEALLSIDHLGRQITSQSFAQLKSIDFKIISLATPGNDLQDLVFPQLKSLRLTCSTRCKQAVRLDSPSLKILSTSFNLSILVQLSCPSSVESLELERNKGVTSENMRRALLLHPNLKSLVVNNLGQCTTVNWNGVLSTGASGADKSRLICPKLVKLSIHGIKTAELEKVVKNRSEVPNMFCQSLRLIETHFCPTPRYLRGVNEVKEFGGMSKEMSSHFEC